MRGQCVIRQSLGREIPVFLGHPFLQAAMGMDDKRGHRTILLLQLRTDEAKPLHYFFTPSPRMN